MADAVVTPTVIKSFKTGRVIRATGTAAIGADPLTYATGGIVCDWSGKVPSSKPPVKGTVQFNGQSGFVYQYVDGTTSANGKVKVFCNTAGGANAALGEHTAAAVVAGVSGDTITWEAEFEANL